MSKKKNLIAGTILICLIGIYVALQLGVIEPKEEQTPSNDKSEKAIFICELEEISSIHITNDDGSFSFEKEGEDWICSEKPNVELEQFSITSLAYDFTSLIPNRIIEDQGTELEKYGLHQPQASICFVLKDGSETKFLLGNATEGGYYFMKDGEKTVYLMNEIVGNGILQPLSAYRKSSLFTASEESIKTVFYQVGEKTYKINRIQQNQWEMTEPYQREVYHNSFSESFITPALELQINEFYDDVIPEECGLKEPAYKLQISVGEQTDILLIGNENEAGMRYAMWESKEAVFGISKDSLEFLDTNPLTFMMSYVYLPHIDTVESFTGSIQDKAFSMVLKRTGEKTEYYFNDKKIDSELWKEKFQVLLTAEIVDFTNDAITDGKPVVSYTAKLTDGTETKIAYYPMNDRSYAVSYNGKVCFVVNKNTIDALVENF